MGGYWDLGFLLSGLPGVWSEVMGFVGHTAVL